MSRASLPNNQNTDCLETLSSRVRVLTEGQVAEWFRHTKHPTLMARQWITRGCKACFLERKLLLSHPEISLEVPILVFTPGDTDPNFDHLAWRLKKRWHLPAGRTTVVWATEVLRAQFRNALRHRRIRLSEVTHDIHVSRLFLNLRRQDPHRAALWTPEDSLSWHKAQSRPDAILGDTWIEFGGAYSAKKLRRMHDMYRNYKYELW